MKRLLWLPLIAITLACPGAQLEQTARDVSASLGGLLQTAQSEHQECLTDASSTTCHTIQRGVSGQNALVTALETYCSWSTTAPPPDSTTQCVPVASAQAALKSAISNANELTTEVKGTVKP
jgi:hypothetical protein